MIKTLAERLEAIDSKVKKLAHKYEILKKENNLLMDENIRLKQDVKKNKTNPELSGKGLSKDGVDQKIQGDQSPGNVKIKAEIDKYVSEIDHCIQQLQNL